MFKNDNYDQPVFTHIPSKRNYSHWRQHGNDGRAGKALRLTFSACAIKAGAGGWDSEHRVPALFMSQSTTDLEDGVDTTG